MWPAPCKPPCLRYTISSQKSSEIFARRISLVGQMANLQSRLSAGRPPERWPAGRIARPTLVNDPLIWPQRVFPAGFGFGTLKPGGGTGNYGMQIHNYLSDTSGFRGGAGC